MFKRAWLIQNEGGGNCSFGSLWFRLVNVFHFGKSQSGTGNAFVTIKLRNGKPFFPWQFPKVLESKKMISWAKNFTLHGHHRYLNRYDSESVF